jgi:hypothetical protein
MTLLATLFAQLLLLSHMQLYYDLTHIVEGFKGLIISLWFDVIA